VWVVRNKIDLEIAEQGGRIEPYPESSVGSKQPILRISASRGDGISELIAAVTTFAREYFGSGEEGLIGRERQRELLRETADALGRSMMVVGDGEELAAEELRAAAQALGRLLGRVDVEDILDVIFREFCIGK
jgi:tRNA modification GTPase